MDNVDTLKTIWFERYLHRPLVLNFGALPDAVNLEISSYKQRGPALEVQTIGCGCCSEQMEPGDYDAGDDATVSESLYGLARTLIRRASEISVMANAVEEMERSACGYAPFHSVMAAIDGQAWYGRNSPSRADALKYVAASESELPENWTELVGCVIGDEKVSRFMSELDKYKERGRR